jgi:hypothetical protein
MDRPLKSPARIRCTWVVLTESGSGCEPPRGISNEQAMESHVGPECEYSVWIIFSKNLISAFYEVLLFSHTIDGTASFVTESHLIRIIHAAVWPR